MAVGIAVYLLWKADPVGLQFPQPLFLATLVVCPAFILSIAGRTGVQPALAVVLLAGTIRLRQWMSLRRRSRRPVCCDHDCAEAEKVSLRRLACRLLLGHAVQRAQSPDEVAAVDPDDLSPGHQLGQDVERNRGRWDR